MLGCIFNLAFIRELLEIDSFGYRLFCDLFCMNFPLKWGFGGPHITENEGIFRDVVVCSLVPDYQSIRHCIQEDHNLYSHLTFDRCLGQCTSKCTAFLLEWE